MFLIPRRRELQLDGTLVYEKVTWTPNRLQCEPVDDSQVFERRTGSPHLARLVTIY